MAIYYYATGGQFDPETGELVDRQVYFANSRVTQSYSIGTEETLIANNNYVNIPANFRIDVPAHRLFAGCKNTTITNIESVNTSDCESFHSMFYDCPNLTSVDMSSGNTSNVLSMNSMFQDCPNLQSVNVTGGNVGKVWDFSYMFDGDSNLSQIMATEDTDGEAEMDQSGTYESEDMFRNCTSLPNFIEGSTNVGMANDDYGYFSSIHIPKWVECETYEKVEGYGVKISPRLRDDRGYENIFWEKY